MTTRNYNVNHLSFGIDKILSSESTFKNVEKSKISTIPSYSASYSNPGISGGLCDFFPYYTNCFYFQHPRGQSVTSVDNNFGNVFGNCNNIIRPSPVRPVPKESVPMPSGHTSQIENNCRRKSWSRAVFNSLQRKGLERRFAIQKYITKPDRRQLAATLGLSDAQVKVWFQNRRMKWRHAKDGEKVSEALQDNAASKRNLHTTFMTTLNKDNEIKSSDEEDIDIESDVLLNINAS